MDDADDEDAAFLFGDAAAEEFVDASSEDEWGNAAPRVPGVAEGSGDAAVFGDAAAEEFVDASSEEDWGCGGGAPAVVGVVAPLRQAAPPPAAAVESAGARPKPKAKRRAAAKREAPPDPVWRAMTEQLLGDESAHVSSMTVCSEACGADPSKFKQKLWALAEATYRQLEARSLLAIRRGIDLISGAAGHANRCQGLLFMRWRKYDGTKQRCSVTSLIDIVGETLGQDAEAGKHEIIVLQAGWAMLLRRLNVSGPDADRMLLVTGTLPTTIAAVSSSSAECMVTILQQQISDELNVAVESSFMREVDMSVVDGAGGNARGERYLTSTLRRALLLWHCLAHRKALVATHTVSILDPFCSNQIRLALSMKGGGTELVKREVRQHISATLVVYLGASPPTDAVAYRERVCDVFLGGSDPVTKYRRALLCKLFNGDWRKTGIVEHYCTGCCLSRRHTLKIMATKGVYALLPHAIGPIMRANWTGSEGSVDDVAILEYVHGMFSAGYLRAHPTPRAEAAAAAVAARGAIVMVAEVLHDAGDGPEAPLRDADGAEARPADRAEAKADSIYKEDAETRIKGTRAWLLSGNFASDLLLARKVLACTGPLCLDQLRLSGQNWERGQQRRMMREGKRTFQTWEVYENKAGKDLMEKAFVMLLDSSQWDLLDRKNEVTSLGSFKVASRLGGACYHYSIAHQRWYPFRSFYALVDEGIWADFGDKGRDCQYDAYTYDAVQHYRELQALGGSAMHGEFMTIVAVGTSDDAYVEREHTATDRRGMVQRFSHHPDLESLSAWRLGRQFREATEMLEVTREGARNRMRKVRPKPKRAGKRKREARKKGKPRGSWAWRLFVHYNCRGGSA